MLYGENVVILHLHAWVYVFHNVLKNSMAMLNITM